MGIKIYIVYVYIFVVYVNYIEGRVLFYDGHRAKIYNPYNKRTIL